MAVLNKKPTLSDLQKYIKEIGIERGWNKNNYLEIFLLLSEEVGELAKSIRNYTGLYAEENKKGQTLQMEEEFADVLNYLFDLANCFDINLEKAFREKDNANAKRVWTTKKDTTNF